MTPENPRAFPLFVPSDGQHGPFSNDGMSLRDWFAGQALAGWMSDPIVSAADDEERTTIARICYSVADAMLIERLRQDGEQRR